MHFALYAFRYSLLSIAPFVTEPNPCAFVEERNPETTLPTVTPTPTRKGTTTLPTTKPTTPPPTTTPRPTVLVPETNQNQNNIWSCDFDGSNGQSDWCRMEQDEFDDFDWTIQSGKTPSEETGPEEAYDGEYYIYIEASNPRRTGDKAT